jgi:hypothetical protein
MEYLERIRELNTERPIHTCGGCGGGSYLKSEMELAINKEKKRVDELL